jgi:tRNA dimethylallyltransferase
VTPHQPPVFLTGPTASGKTAVGIALAQRLDAEIVSMDSMAVFRGMDIGTAKPSAAEQSQVPHHLIDQIDPWDDFSLSDYLAAVARVADQIAGRGRRVLFVGGTPLYLKSLLHGVDTGPPPDRLLRARLEAEARAHGSVALHQRLGEIDPVAASRIHPRDARRLVRAIEVFEQTGRPISARQVHFHAPPVSRGPVFCLRWPREQLYERIDQRVRWMFEQGFVAEVCRLLDQPRPLSRTARQALGYKEVIEHLERATPLQETIELVQRRTRQFAKRQLTWFRGMPDNKPILMSATITTPEVVAEIAALM